MPLVKMEWKSKISCADEKRQRTAAVQNAGAFTPTTRQTAGMTLAGEGSGKIYSVVANGR